MSHSPLSPRARPRSFFAPRLRVEQLEDRTLLSLGCGGGHFDLTQSIVNPIPGDLSSILVRFQSDLNARTGADFLPGTTIGPELGLVPNLHRVEVGRGLRVDAALAAYRASPLVKYAEPSFSLRPSSTIPNDPQFGQLWALYNRGQTGGRVNAHINAPPAWDYGVGSTSQIAAVIDTGIDYNHPDLYLNIWINEREIPCSRAINLVDADEDGRITFWDLNDPVNQGPFKITDQNGDGRISAADILAPMARDRFGNDLGSGGWANGVSEYGNSSQPDDLVGWDFTGGRGSNAPLDTSGHGTHVAGIIGAIGNNSEGVVGVNWRVQLMPLKVGNDLELNLTATVQALGYAVAHGALVSNHSYVSAGASQALYDAMASARDAGHIIVTAAGNEGRDNDTTPVYPASFNLENLFAVAATDHHDELAGFSNYGLTSVHLGAPGAQVLSTSAGGGYTVRSGTSMAAAFVTGAVAFFADLYPQTSYRGLMDLILRSTELIPALAGRTISGGRLSLAPSPGGGGIIIIDALSFGGTGGSAPGVGDPGGEELSVEGSVPLEATDRVALSVALAAPSAEEQVSLPSALSTRDGESWLAAPLWNELYYGFMPTRRTV